MSSKKWRALPVLSAAALVLVMAACGSSGGGSSSSGSTKTKTIGVILPDTTTSPRWEANDRPSLNAAFTAAGVKGDIQNAGVTRRSSAPSVDEHDQRGRHGPHDRQPRLRLRRRVPEEGQAAAASRPSTTTASRSAAARPTTCRSTTSRSASSRARACRSAWTTAGKTKANIVYINGCPTDNNATLFKPGYVAALSRRSPRATTSSSATRAVPTGTPPRPATLFEQMYTQNKGKIDGVVSANDTHGRRHHRPPHAGRRRRQGAGDRSGRDRRGPAARSSLATSA